MLYILALTLSLTNHHRRVGRPAGTCAFVGRRFSLQVRGALHSSTTKRRERRQKLEYMQSMIRELRDLSAPEKCDMVTYFLELAYIETCDEIRDIHAEGGPEPQS